MMNLYNKSRAGIVKAAFTLLFFSLAVTALAQQEKGDVQMQFSLSLRNSSVSGTSTTSMSYQFGVSKFITRHLEMGIAYGGFSQKAVSSSSLTPFLNLNILSKNGKFVFYMGAQYFLSYTSIPDTQAVLSGGVGGKLGIRSYFTDNAFLFIGPNFSFLPNDQTEFDLTAGIGILLKKTRKTE